MRKFIPILFLAFLLGCDEAGMAEITASSTPNALNVVRVKINVQRAVSTSREAIQKTIDLLKSRGVEKADQRGALHPCEFSVGLSQSYDGSARWGNVTLTMDVNTNSADEAMEYALGNLEARLAERGVVMKIQTEKEK